LKIIITANTAWNIYHFRYELVKNLLKNNEVYVLSKRDDTSKKLISLGCKLINIDINQHGKNIFKELKLLYLFFINIKKISPDILLSYTIKPNLYSGLICRLLKISNIVTITGLGEVFLKENIFKKIIIQFYKISIKKSSFVFFQNKNDLKYFKSLNIIKYNNVGIINGSGIKINKKKIKKIQNKYFTFLYIGRLIKEKGIHELIVSFKNLSRYKNRVKLVLIGSFYEQSFKQKILNQAKYNKNIIFKNFTKNVEFHIKKSDCIVLPSYREGLPRSLLDGMNFSKPLIASNVPGCSELIKNGFNGYLCKKEDILSLEECMNKILNNKILYKMGNNGKKIILPKYDIKITIQKIIKKIHKIKKS